jgi:hypothetical protein
VNTHLETASDVPTTQHFTIRDGPSLGQMELFDIFDQISFKALA